MRIQFSVVGTVERHADVWAALETVPRVGDCVDLPGISQADTVVRTVVWYPLGSDEDTLPFAYVVLGQERPT